MEINQEYCWYPKLFHRMSRTTVHFQDSSGIEPVNHVFGESSFHLWIKFVASNPESLIRYLCVKTSTITCTRIVLKVVARLLVDNLLVKKRGGGDHEIHE